MTFELAAHGPEAPTRIRPGAAFDLAILDMQMPNMDGAVLAEALQNMVPELPLVMLSSQWPYCRPTPNFRASLTKPVKPAQLYETLVSIVEPGAVAPTPAPVGPQYDTHAAERLPLEILLAEDNVVNQQVALRMLQRMGCRADVIANGQEVLDALHRHFYDVILLDVQMPEMDGLEAARRICREWPDFHRPRLVAMTALAMQGDRELCLAAGMDDHISKPVKIEELYQALLRCAPSAPAMPAEAPPRQFRRNRRWRRPPSLATSLTIRFWMSWWRPWVKGARWSWPNSSPPTWAMPRSLWATGKSPGRTRCPYPPAAGAHVQIQQRQPGRHARLHLVPQPRGRAAAGGSRLDTARLAHPGGAGCRASRRI